MVKRSDDIHGHAGCHTIILRTIAQSTWSRTRNRRIFCGAQAVADKAIEARIGKIRETCADLADKVGVFEGAGDSAKGLFRSQIYCIMISSPKLEFCAVCRRALAAAIDYYAR